MVEGKEQVLQQQVWCGKKDPNDALDILKNQVTSSGSDALMKESLVHVM